MAATLTALAVAALAFPTSAHGGSADNDPGIHVKRVETPRYVVRPDTVTVSLRLTNEGPAWSRNVRSTITLTQAWPSAAVPHRDHAKRRSAPEGRAHSGAGGLRRRPRRPLQSEGLCQGQARKRRVIDCKNGKDFPVIPLSFQGTATVTAPLFNEPGTQAVQGSTAGEGTAFFFEQRVGTEFSYGASGSVTFYVDGTDPNGCKWSGSTTVTDSTGDKLTLSEELISYRFVPQTSFVPYAATADCPPPLQDTNTTLHSGPWLPGFPQIRSSRTPLILSGTTPVIPGLPGGYVWSFSAQ